VDDMLIFGTSVSVVNEAKRLLSSLFEMKDIREVDVILGIKLGQTKSGFPSCLSHYIEKRLKIFNSFDVVPMRSENSL